MTKAIIIEDLETNRDHYLFITNTLRLSKETLIKREDDLFYKDILDGYKIALTELIAEDICARLNLDIENTLITLEEINIINYIEGNN